MFFICQLKELKTVASKDLKIAETPEEHKLLSNLSKVKSLWEESFSLAPERTCPNPEPMVNNHLKEQSDVGQSTGETQLPAKKEAWGPVPETHKESDEIKLVDADQKEKEIVASDGKMQATSSPSDETSEETNVKHQTTGTTPEEPPRRKPTRRGGRGRKPKGSRYIETDTNAVQKLEETFLEDEQIATKCNRQSDHDERKYDDIAVGTSPQKARSGVKNKEQKVVEGSSESGAQHEKKSPSGSEDRGKGQPEITHQEVQTAERRNAPRNSTEGLKGAVPKKKNASSVKDEQKKGQQRSRKSMWTNDAGNPLDSVGEEVEDGAFKRKGAQSSGRKGVKKGSGGSSQDARRAESGDSSRNPSKAITDATSSQKDSLTSAKGGGRLGSEVSSQVVQSADSRSPHGHSVKNGGDGASNRKGPPTSTKNGGKKGPEGSSQGARTEDSSDTLEGRHKPKGGKGGSPKQKGPPTSKKNGDKKGLEGSSQGSRKADSADSPGSSIKADTGGSPKQKDSSTSTNDRENKGSERGLDSVRTADSGDSSGSLSKGAKGESPNQKRSPSNANDRQKKGPEPAEKFANSPRDSSQGGRGGASNRRRRRHQSRANSEGKGGEKKHPRSRSNSEPDRHP